MNNELKSYHNKTEWAKFVRMQDSCQQLKSYSISWRKTLKNSHNSQMEWLVVSTLCQEMKKHLRRKGWIRGNTKNQPVLEVSTWCSQGKYGVEIRIMSKGKDNSYSRFRIFDGSNKFVMNLNSNEQEIPEVQLEEYNVQQKGRLRVQRWVFRF